MRHDLNDFRKNSRRNKKIRVIFVKIFENGECPDDSRENFFKIKENFGEILHYVKMEKRN
jgi:hypothetical protein